MHYTKSNNSATVLKSLVKLAAASSIQDEIDDFPESNWYEMWHADHHEPDDSWKEAVHTPADYSPEQVQDILYNFEKLRNDPQLAQQAGELRNTLDSPETPQDQAARDFLNRQSEQDRFVSIYQQGSGGETDWRKMFPTPSTSNRANTKIGQWEKGYQKSKPGSYNHMNQPMGSIPQYTPGAKPNPVGLSAEQRYRNLNAAHDSREYGSNIQAQQRAWDDQRSRFAAMEEAALIARRGLPGGRRTVDKYFPMSQRPGYKWSPNGQQYPPLDGGDMALHIQNPDGSNRFWQRGANGKLTEVSLTPEQQSYYLANQRSRNEDDQALYEKRQNQAQLEANDKAFRQQFAGNKEMMDSYNKMSADEQQWQAEQAAKARMLPRPQRLTNYNQAQAAKRYRQSYVRKA